VGIAVVPYLVYVELAVIRAICLYCTVMHAAIVVDFACYKLRALLQEVKAEGRHNGAEVKKVTRSTRPHRPLPQSMSARSSLTQWT